MSKELEALNKIWRDAYPKSCETWSADKLCEHWRVLEKALTPPTAEEVCEALSDFYKEKVSYSNERYNHMFYFEESKLGILRFMNNGVYFIQSDYHKTNDLPPHLITLIGRFYEGLK